MSANQRVRIGTRGSPLALAQTNIVRDCLIAAHPALAAPDAVTIGSGRSARIDYADPERPVLAAKLQELFGRQPPLAALGGRLPLTLHLLSPAGRPLQITQDLEHFWDNAYVEVAREMRGRYPKHPWPDDPRTAVATARTKQAEARRGG